jgi:hypothetical protein
MPEAMLAMAVPDAAGKVADVVERSADAAN